LLGAVVIFVIFFSVAPPFRDASSLSTVLYVSSTYGIMSVAVALLMIGGEFDLSAGVAFYGSAPNLADVPKIKAPLMIQSAEVDERINASWPAYEEALKAANVKYERYLYAGTQHGFHNDTTPRYDATAAKLAWERTLAFFKKNVV